MAPAKSGMHDRKTRSYNNLSRLFRDEPHPFGEYKAGDAGAEIEGRPVMDATLTIFILAGTLINTERINQQQQKISVSSLANGVYIVELWSGLLTARQKLIVIR